MKLNLASGSDYKLGFLNLDIVQWPRYPEPDIYWDLRSGLLPFFDNTVEEVYCGYTLLHAMPRYRFSLLNEIYRVLIPTGKAVFSEVDMRLAMKRWLENPRDMSYNELIWGELGSIHGEEFAEWDTHHHGYCQETLTEELIKHNFIDLNRVNVHDPGVWYELTIVCKKGKNE